eukprot:9451659-Lingulodinium_polyedra.AAC.1
MESFTPIPWKFHWYMDVFTPGTMNSTLHMLGQNSGQCSHYYYYHYHYYYYYYHHYHYRGYYIEN